MSVSLATLRQSPQLPVAEFIARQPGCWIQYFDDTAAKDPSKALGAAVFRPATFLRKQHEQCACCFSLQAFGQARTRKKLLWLRNLGIDVDLVPAAERATLSPVQIDRRKDAYLARTLWPFPLKPQLLIETCHGFHVIYRVSPQRSLLGIRAAAALNVRLVRALQGDEKAMLLTQVLRVAGTYSFKDPGRPFLCRLLLDNAGKIPPYDLDTLRDVLNAWEVFHGEGGGPAATPTPRVDPAPRPPRWYSALGGVAEGNRNAMAASLVGGILSRLPETLWETGGWGGLREWNARNPVALRESELRRVFESIARRELMKRRQWEAARAAPGNLPAPRRP
jgi:hypothetical protein